MEWTESSSDNGYDKYKSYIQRRRIAPGKGAGESIGGAPPGGTPTGSETRRGGESLAEALKDRRSYTSEADIPIPEAGEDGMWSSLGGKKTDNENQAPIDREDEDDISEGFSDEADEDTDYSSFGGSGSRTRVDEPSIFRKTDPGLYRRMQKTGGQSRHAMTSRRLPVPAGSYPSVGMGQRHTSAYSGGTYQSGAYQNAEGGSNRLNVLAVKIIKQSLACFAILGLILLLQERSDMSDVLAFVKKQVVDTHIEPKSLMDGFQNLVAECSRWLGGSP